MKKLIVLQYLIWECNNCSESIWFLMYEIIKSFWIKENRLAIKKIEYTNLIHMSYKAQFLFLLKMIYHCFKFALQVF